MLQYAVLAWSRQYLSLSRWTDNILILYTPGEEGLFTPDGIALLTEVNIAEDKTS